MPMMKQVLLTALLRGARIGLSTANGVRSGSGQRRRIGVVVTT